MKQLDLPLDRPALSVIIPVHNGGAKFRQCLASLTPAPLDIIVVANGDTDGSAQVAGAFGAQVIRLPEACGPAQARNAGAQAAKGEVLLFLDADVSVLPDTLAQVTLEPGVAAVFGSYDDAPAETNFLSQYKNLFHHYVHQTGRTEAATFWAGCGAIRRDVFLAVGGFDEKYRQPSIEDIELGYRLRRAGYAIRLRKTLQVKHLKRWTVRSLLHADFWCRAVPWTELMQRDRQMLDDLNVTWAARVAVVLAYLGLLELFFAWWLALISLTAMFALHAGLLRFFVAKRGLGFAMATLPWLWFYNLYSGLGFVVGLVRHWTR
ncbi:MAG: glycosyltransferase [Verrucomicrobiota bacterium]